MDFYDWFTLFFITSKKFIAFIHKKTDMIINKITTKNMGGLILPSLDLSFNSFKVFSIHFLILGTLVKIPGFPMPYLLHSSLMLISAAIPTSTSEPFLYGLQKVILARGCKYFSALAINFCTHEDLEQNLILVINSLKSALKFVNSSFAFGFRNHNIFFAWM